MLSSFFFNRWFALFLLISLIIRYFLRHKHSNTIKRVISRLNTLSSTKHILVINGAPRTSGNTATALRTITSYLNQQPNVEARLVHLAEYDLHQCRGCAACVMNCEPCRMKDDFIQLLREIEAADGILVGAPVYCGSVPGLTKVFIDRLAPCYHRPAFQGKPSAVLVTTGGAFASRVASYLTETLQMIGSLPVGSMCTSLFKPFPADLTENKQFRKSVDRLLAYTVLPREQWVPGYSALLTYTMQRCAMGIYGLQVDRDYWRAQGLTGNKLTRDYYFPCKISWLQRQVLRIARTAFAIVLRLTGAPAKMLKAPMLANAQAHSA